MHVFIISLLIAENGNIVYLKGKFILIWARSRVAMWIAGCLNCCVLTFHSAEK